MEPIRYNSSKWTKMKWRHVSSANVSPWNTLLMRATAIRTCAAKTTRRMCKVCEHGQAWPSAIATATAESPKLGAATWTLHRLIGAAPPAPNFSPISSAVWRTCCEPATGVSGPVSSRWAELALLSNLLRDKRLFPAFYCAQLTVNHMQIVKKGTSVW